MRDLFGNIDVREVPMMPEAYKGAVHIGSGYTSTNPRRWTDEEIAWIQKLRTEGYSNEEIGTSTGRSAVSIQIKLKRIGKTNNTYNENHIGEKYELNRQFANDMRPSTVLDLYCGTMSYWKSLGISTVTNDMDSSIDADYHEKAEMLIHKLYYDGCRFDVVDLDPYGSAYECFDLSVKMARKGIIITFGEYGHKRWKRLDFVSRYYGIKSLRDFTLKNLVEHVQMIGMRNKKRLIPVIDRKWDRIARVWFEIKPIIITEQWN